VTIAVGTGGLFGFAGHPHEIAAPALGGLVTLDRADWQRSTVSLEFDAAALRVTGKGEPARDVPEVQRVMLSDRVLDVKRFPTIAFRSRRVSVATRSADTADLVVEGELTLRGVTRPATARVNVRMEPNGTLVARGSSVIKQTDFGMSPVTAAAGTVRVKDELGVQFLVRAHPRAGGG
jgi:polyisoprenoid-binding protein YceI